MILACGWSLLVVNACQCFYHRNKGEKGQSDSPKKTAWSNSSCEYQNHLPKIETFAAKNETQSLSTILLWAHCLAEQHAKPCVWLNTVLAMSLAFTTPVSRRSVPSLGLEFVKTNNATIHASHELQSCWFFFGKQACIAGKYRTHDPYWTAHELFNPRQKQWVSSEIRR